jgi:hypothetical protein
MFTARPGAGQTLPAQEIDKALARFDICSDIFAVQGQGDLHA